MFWGGCMFGGGSMFGGSRSVFLFLEVAWESPIYVLDLHRIRSPERDPSLLLRVEPSHTFWKKLLQVLQVFLKGCRLFRLREEREPRQRRAVGKFLLHL